MGADVDGADKKIIFGHGTLKSVIGIDDNQDVFAINTDATFEAVNDLEINTDGDIVIGNGSLNIPDGELALGKTGVTVGYTTLHRGGSSAPGYIKFQTADGTYQYMFIEDDGTVKLHSSVPTANGDGDAVGGQSD